MAYVTKFDGRTDKTIKIGGEGNPTSIEGYFLGSKDTSSDFGPGKLHLFQTEEGVIGVWGKTRMNNLLTADLRGQMVLVNFTGMIAPSKKGRRPSYGYKVQHDTQNVIDVSNIDLTSTLESSEDSETEVDSYESNAIEVLVDRHPVAPKTPATTPSAERRAQVQALLNKNRA